MSDASVRKLAVINREEAGRDVWVTPDLSLLGNGHRPSPRFPVDLMKPFWAEWIKRAAETASAPLDYVAVSLLTSVSAVIANGRWPQAGAGWKEPPILWTGLVGSPSSGKSPALDIVFEMLADVEEKMAAGFDEEQRKFETDKVIADARREAWEDAVRSSVKKEEPPRSSPAGSRRSRSARATSYQGCGLYDRKAWRLGCLPREGTVAGAR